MKLLRMLGEPSTPGHVHNMSASGLCVMLPLPLPCGASVRIQAEKIVMFGEVVRCEPFEDSYAIGFALRQSEAVETDSLRVKVAD